MKHSNLHVIAMIPARLQATRFPRKLLQDLGGKSVIARTYLNTKATGLFNDVIVVTDSQEIFDDIQSHGGQVIMSQTEHSCGSDRIAEAVEHIDTDIVLNVQGDEPFTDKDSLENLLDVFRQRDAEQIDLASLMTPLDDEADIQNPNYVKVIVNQQNFALYFSRSPVPYHRNQSISVQYFRHKGIYAFRKQAILDFSKLPMLGLEAAEQIECIRFLEYGKTIKMVETEENSFGIDTPQDLERAKAFLNQQKS
ncbi:3-deoxy-manno-octulosonate cytidylyltransferase [Mesohalobacter salilacus]|uniref:3-deoxy-manno-octulosonate cytidylyltransferase n=1 Tax=Mesohalobacter salilacus TaxID=2491711 RepID=UPI0026B8BA6C